MEEKKVELNTASVIKEFYSIDTRDLITWEVIYNAFHMTGSEIYQEINVL